jgi:hypothetical protein
MMIVFASGAVVVGIVPQKAMTVLVTRFVRMADAVPDEAVIVVAGVVVMLLPKIVVVVVVVMMSVRRRRGR